MKKLDPNRPFGWWLECESGTGRFRVCRSLIEAKSKAAQYKNAGFGTIFDHDKTAVAWRKVRHNLLVETQRIEEELQDAADVFNAVIHNIEGVTQDEKV